ncbi:MAG: corrinoid protein [Chloroflexota bacterium]|nr:corrinoid protein [Chloroflexota bacterium]
MDELKGIVENLIEGEADTVTELVRTALDQGISVERVLNEGLIAGMNEVGEQFKRGDIYLPEVLFAAKAMKQGMEILEPLLVGAGVKPLGRVILGTVRGDVHDIGKNLVGVMMKGAGFEVIDLGVDTSPERFVAAALEHDAPLIGMSALLGTTIPCMKETVEALAQAGLKGRVKILIGGAIVTQSYADEIGADGYASDAASAVTRAKEILGMG